MTQSGVGIDQRIENTDIYPATIFQGPQLFNNLCGLKNFGMRRCIEEQTKLYYEFDVKKTSRAMF